MRVAEFSLGSYLILIPDLSHSNEWNNAHIRTFINMPKFNG